MAAIGSTVAAEDLALAGITGDLAAALTGLTWAQAKLKLKVVLGLSAGNEAVQRGAVVSYTINGKSLQTNIDQIKQAMAAIDAGLSAALPSGSGPSFVPIAFRP